MDKSNRLIISFCIGFVLLLYIIRDKNAPVERFQLSEKNKAVTPHSSIDKLIEVEFTDSLNNSMIDGDD